MQNELIPTALVGSTVSPLATAVQVLVDPQEDESVQLPKLPPAVAYLVIVLPPSQVFIEVLYQLFG